MNDERWSADDIIVVCSIIAATVIIVAGIISGNGCAALRQNAGQARAGTVSAIEAPQRVESGATVVDALGAAVSSDIEKTDKLADRVDRLEARDVNVGDRVGGDGDSIALWIAIAVLGFNDVMGPLVNLWDRRRFHRNGAETKRPC